MVLEATINASALDVRQDGASSLLWAHGRGTRALSYHGARGRGLFAMSASGAHSPTADGGEGMTCSDAAVYASAMCYVRYGATDESGAVLTPTTDDYGDASAAFEHSRDLSSAFRVSWSVEGRGTPQITLSLLMQAGGLGSGPGLGLLE